MRFWRICRRRYVAKAASGEGARLYGGRWNSRGVRVVYASTSLALAAVETFVNLEPNLRPKDLVSIEGDIPDALEIARVDLKALPANWHKTERNLCAASETTGFALDGPRLCLCHQQPSVASGMCC